MSSGERLWLRLGGGLLVLVSVLTVIAWRGVSALQQPVSFSEVAYVGSESCAGCHDDRLASWHRTYHRTMTQSADERSVRGQFDGQILDAFGGKVRPVQADGAYFFEYLDGQTDQVQARVPLQRTVGSHRYQQYLSRDAQSETYYRLHYLWHMEDQRWVHLNAAFLGDDQQPFDANVSTWNTNCVFCHNTGPVPQVLNMESIRARARAGETLDVRTELRFDTQLAELGIGCETCHGPGAAHLARMDQFVQRWLATLFARSDASIVNPQTLSGARANDVCGACHAGRTLATVASLDRWFKEGPSFRPGDELAQHVLPLSAATPSPAAHLPGLFRDRFWRDGSPRLTAYEYQGVNASACAVDGDFTCIRCHSMHGGDPAGMLPEANRGDAPCLRCHQDLREKIAQHSGHEVNSAGARCMACHMPREVFGVMTMHRTHQISIPNVEHDLAAGKPNACLNCHANEAAAFALRNAADLDSPVTSTLVREDGGDPSLADGLLALLAGDPVRQAVAAFELGRVEQAPSGEDLLVRVPWLLAGLADDRPAIRRFSWKSLQAIDQHLAGSKFALDLQAPLGDFDYTGAPTEREAAILKLNAAFVALNKSDWPTPGAATALSADYRLDPMILAQLMQLGLRSDKQIDIGE